MLKSLRRKFVLVIMVLVGIVLITVLSGSFISTWQTQHDITDEALERAVQGSIFDLPKITVQGGENPNGEGMNLKNAPKANMLVLAIDIDANGVILATNDAPLLIDHDTLESLVDMVLASDKSCDWDTSNHLAWHKLQRSSGAWRIAIADTSAVDIGLRTLAIKDLVIILAALGVMLIISVGLSIWIVKPVEQAWNQQRRFVADASHELKTPLAVIIANNQILASDPNIPKESQRWIESTADESAHMKNLVEELLELARTDETVAGSQGVMQKAPVDFSAMVENAALEFDAIAFERGTSIEESIEEGIKVSGDPEWLERLCKILIDNACKYSAKGSPVSVKLSHDSRHCTLSVNNFGNTIDPEDLPHVFERFYRTDKARSRNAKTGGFGLGLAIAQGIANSHGGTISVTSNEASGTTFTVVLPTIS